MTTFLMKIISTILAVIVLLSGVVLTGKEAMQDGTMPIQEDTAPDENLPEVDPVTGKPTEQWLPEIELAEEAADYDIQYDMAAPAATANATAAYKREYIVDPEYTVDYYDDSEMFDEEKYEPVEENPFCLVQSEPLSTFSADVDTASYANVRRMIEYGYSPDYIHADAVRAEEFINYFSYDLNAPEGDEKFGVTKIVAPCPWNSEHQLLFLGLKTQDIDLSDIPQQNLVFLIDVSGSMLDDNKLPLLKKSFLALLDNLDEEDTVSIVTYASGVETVLDRVKCDDKDTIRDAIENLEAGGGTYGEGGIQRAYEIAERGFIEGGNNRVILATDGDLNIGISEPDQLEKLITEKKETGIYLSVLGYGMYNYRDDNMERLADCGNGNYAYIDSLLEAKKVLVEEMGSTLLTVADDVKLQVEFNPDKVNSYRLIGYENRLMMANEFRDDTKDAGEIGAGHSVVALYELVPTGSAQAVTLKYQDQTKPETENTYASEYATLFVRYKEPGEATASEKDYPITEEVYTETPNDEFRFAAAAAEFALILKDSEFKGDSSLEHLSGILKEMTLDDEYRQEMAYLVRRLEGQNY